VKKIAQVAKDGKYQLACACFFEATHDIEDVGTTDLNMSHYKRGCLLCVV